MKKFSFDQDYFEYELNYYYWKFKREYDNEPSKEINKINFDIIKMFKDNFRIKSIHTFESTKELLIDINNYEFKECKTYNVHHYIRLKLNIIELLFNQLRKSDKNGITQKN